MDSFHAKRVYGSSAVRRYLGSEMPIDAKAQTELLVSLSSIVCFGTAMM
jgi:hypothetical protein